MNKPRWTLFVYRGGDIEEGTDRQADNLEEAEKIAKELYKEYDDGNYCDLMIYCAPHHEYNNDYAEHHPQEDFPVWSRDCFGDSYWRVMRVDDYGPAYLDFDKSFIQKIKNYEEAHKPKHMTELSLEQIEVLTKTIGWGSMYLSDYSNDFDVDEKEVSDYAEGYTDSLYEEYGDDWFSHIDAEDWYLYCAV